MSITFKSATKDLKPNNSEMSVNRNFEESIVRLVSGGKPEASGCNRGIEKNKYIDWKKEDSNYFSDNRPSKFLIGLSKAPFIWKYYREEFSMEFLGGFIGVHQNNDCAVEPAIGWAVRDSGKK